MGLQPSPSAHPEVHQDGQPKHDCHHGGEYLLTGPTDEVSDRFEEIHAEEAGDEGDGHEKGCDDGEYLHNLVHAVVRDREVGIQGAADEVS